MHIEIQVPGDFKELNWEEVGGLGSWGSLGVQRVRGGGGANCDGGA